MTNKNKFKIQKAKSLRDNKHKIKQQLKKLDREKEHLHRQQQDEMALRQHDFDRRLGFSAAMTGRTSCR